MRKFVESYPGGLDVLEDVAGTDSTEDFEAIYNQKKAGDMWKKY